MDSARDGHEQPVKTLGNPKEAALHVRRLVQELVHAGNKVPKRCALHAVGEIRDGIREAVETVAPLWGDLRKAGEEPRLRGSRARRAGDQLGKALPRKLVGLCKK